MCKNVDLIEKIKSEISLQCFSSIKSINCEDYEEGCIIACIWTYESTPAPMIIDIRLSNIDENLSLESWIYFLKQDGNIDDEYDYKHYDGSSIISYEDLQKVNYEDFISAIYNNANSYLLERSENNERI